METRAKLAFGMTVVPIAFFLRALARFGDAQATHAESEANFERELTRSQARQQEAGAQGVGRDTSACVEWAMADCHPGVSNCNTCMDALRGCLETSTRNEAYCAAVPNYRATMPPADEAASTAWQKEQGAKYGLTHWTCSAMFKFVQLHCHPLK